MSPISGGGGGEGVNLGGTGTWDEVSISHPLTFGECLNIHGSISRILVWRAPSLHRTASLCMFIQLQLCLFVLIWLFLNSFGTRLGEKEKMTRQKTNKIKQYILSRVGLQQSCHVCEALDIKIYSAEGDVSKLLLLLLLLLQFVFFYGLGIHRVKRRTCSSELLCT